MRYYSMWKDLRIIKTLYQLRNRRALKLYKVYRVTPFWFSWVQRYSQTAGSQQIICSFREIGIWSISHFVYWQNKDLGV